MTKTKTFATIQYAPKPWDRGRPPMTRTVEVPNGYTLEKAVYWAWEKSLIRIGETVISVETRDAALGHPNASGGE